MNKFKNNVKGNFTVIPNCVTDDPDISWKAKGIFSYLASKPDNWNFYVDEIKTNATDGKTALQSGIKELEENGYLKRKRNRKDGRIVGWIWVLDMPDKNKQTENLVSRKPCNKVSGGYNNSNNNNTDNSNNDNIVRTRKSPSSNEKKKPTAKERTKKYIPLAKYLAKVVRSHINYKIDSSRVKSWARDLRLLHEQNDVHPKRQKKVLKWYRKNIGGDYIPEAYSGSSFREKFPKLEAAIKRQKNSPSSSNKPATGYKEDYDFKETEMELD